MKNKPMILLGGVIILFFGLILLSGKKDIKTPSSQTQPTVSSVVPETKELMPGDNICQAFTKEWVNSVTKKAYTSSKEYSKANTNFCNYYMDENNFLTIRLVNLKAEDKKQEEIKKGRKIVTDQTIKMDHFFIMLSEDITNEIILVIKPDLYISMDRVSSMAATEKEIITLAEQIADKIAKGGSQVNNLPTSPFP